MNLWINLKIRIVSVFCTIFEFVKNFLCFWVEEQKNIHIILFHSLGSIEYRLCQ